MSLLILTFRKGKAGRMNSFLLAYHRVHTIISNSKWISYRSGQITHLDPAKAAGRNPIFSETITSASKCMQHSYQTPFVKDGVSRQFTQVLNRTYTGPCSDP